MTATTPLPDWPLLDCGDDGRRPFPVTHDGDDAPDGAVLDLSSDPGAPELWGTWERRGDQWVPVTVAGGGS